MLNLQQERQKREMTQAELGVISNVDPCMISRAECHGFAHMGHLKRLAAALNWKGDPKELLEEVK